MLDYVAFGVTVAVIMVATYVAQAVPESWPACMLVIGATGIICLGYFTLTGDDL